jgi:hypothetical protein
MVKLKYNSTGVDRSKQGDFTPPKPGVYPMVVDSVVQEKANADHPVRIVIVVKMVEADPEGNGKGASFWKYINYEDSTQDWVMDQWIAATGLADTESNPTGEIDTKDMVGKKVLGRVKSDYYGDEYRPKLARVMPLKAGEDEPGWGDTTTTEADGTAEEDQELAGLDQYSSDEVEALGEPADEGDEDAVAALDHLGREAGLDPNDYALWSELAAAIVETMVPAEEPEAPAPAKKSVAKKAAAAPKAAPKKEEPAEEAGEDYASWTLEDINAELEARSLSTSGPMSAKVKRLKENDADPFAG